MEACARIKHVALDMDGTIYLGSTLFPFTAGFLESMRENGIGYSFLTNNPTRSVEAYSEKLKALGIPTDPTMIYTSSTATIDYLRAAMPEVRRLYILGTPSMIAEFEMSGYEIAATDPDDIPDALIVAFDLTITYPRLCHASWLAASGIPYIATNPDKVCPTDRRTVLVDCGSLCQCIRHATDRHPDIVIGKPNPGMIAGIMHRFGLKADEIAMCGDRIYTDVATARNAGALGVLVLSGETTLDTAMTSDPQPPVTVTDIAAFGNMLLQSRNKIAADTVTPLQ